MAAPPPANALGLPTPPRINPTTALPPGVGGLDIIPGPPPAGYMDAAGVLAGGPPVVAPALVPGTQAGPDFGDPNNPLLNFHLVRVPTSPPGAIRGM